MKNKKMNIIIVILSFLMILISCVLIYINSQTSNEISKDNKQIENIIYEIDPTKVSQEGAKVLLEEKFYAAIELYNISQYYFDISDEYIQFNGEYLYLIRDYEEVLQNYFTNKMKKDFEENAIGLEYYENQHWKNKSLDENISNLDGIEELKNVEISEDKITCIVKTRYFSENEERDELKFKENKFVLVKENNTWLIDEFNFSKSY